MSVLVATLAKSGLLKKDLEYLLLRTSMVIIFAFFGYQRHRHHHPLHAERMGGIGWRMLVW